jgi:hypothetical protein
MAKQPADEECSTCSAWFPINEDGVGYCKAHPPAPLFGAFAGQAGTGTPQLSYVFPRTSEVDWCREY